MAEPKKRSLVDRALKRVLGYGAEPIHRAVKHTDAAKQIQAEDNRSLESSLSSAKYGKRTFPTATAVGYATPMYRDAGEIIARNRQARRQFAEPFFRDPDKETKDSKGNPVWPVGRDGNRIWDTVPLRRSGKTNAPHAFPGNVPMPFVNEGPLDQLVGEEHMRIEADRKKKKHGLERDQRVAASKGNFLSDMLFKLIN